MSEIKPNEGSVRGRCAIRRIRNGVLLAGAAVAGLGLAQVASADSNWTGGGADGNWQNPANWNILPQAFDVLNFGGTINLLTNNDFDAETQFNGINFLAGAGGFTLGGNALVLGGDINQQSANSQTISLGLVLDGATSNINVTGGGSLSLGQVAFGLTPTATDASATSSTLNVNSSVTMSGLLARTNNNPLEGPVLPSTIAIGSGQTVTVNGEFTVGIPQTYTNNFAGVQTALDVTGNGSLVVNAGSSLFRVSLPRGNAAGGADPAAFLDLAGLSNFTFTGTNHFRVGNGNARGELDLANTSNTINAGQVRIGDSGLDGGGTGGSENNNPGRSFLRLGGGTNVINTDLFIIGRTKSGGTVGFQGPAGTLTIAGQAGGTSTANIQVGTLNSATGSGDMSFLLLAGHEATVHGGDVIIGQLAGGTGGNSARGEVSFDTGTFNAESLRLGVNASGSAGNGATGNFILGGDTPDSSATGVLNVTEQFFLGQRTNTNASSGPSNAAFMIHGGTANIDADIIDASTTVSSAGPNQTTLTLAGGTLNMMGHNIGTPARPINEINLTSGNLNNAARIAGQTINVGSAVNITGAPTYVIAGGGSLNSSLPALTLGNGGGLEGGSDAGAANVNGDIVAGSGSRIAPGSDTVAGTLQFSNNLTFNGGSTAAFKLSDSPFFGNDQITVFGNLSLSGTVNLEIGALGAGPQVGNTYTLISYSGSLTGNESNFAVSDPGTRATFSVVPTGSTPGTIQLSVGGSPSLALTWIGNINSNWEVGGPNNWRNPSLNPDQFFTQDTVTFDDTSTNMSDVQLVGQLSPGSVTVSANRNYKFAGSGGITGSTNLTKSGSGTLIVATDNSYTGFTDIQSGTLQVGDGGATGSLGTGDIFNNGALAFNRSGSLTVSNTISGGGTLTKNGSGTVTLAGSNGGFFGDVSVNAGTIDVTNFNALGSGFQATIAVGGALDLAGIPTANVAGGFGSKTFNIAGAGPDGNGALTHSGALAQINAFQHVVLTANATVGGTGRFDIRGGTAQLVLGGHTLTKVGPSQFTLVGITVDEGNIVINEGIFSLETTTQIAAAAGSSITYNDGSQAWFFNVPEATGIHRQMIINGNVTMGNASGPTGGADRPSYIGSNVELNGDLTFDVVNNAFGPLILTGDITETGGPRNIIKTGTTTAGTSAPVTLTGNLGWTGSTTVNNGTLVLGSSLLGTSSVTIADGASVQLSAGGGKVLRTPSLSTGSTGVLDLTDNELVVPNGSIAAINALVVSGRAGGSWDGPGINSSAAAGTTDRALGIGLDGSDVRVKFTYAGDASLDGAVTIADLGILAANWQGTDRFWYQGDFNFDGNVTIADLGILAANWQKGVGAGAATMSFEEAMAMFDVFDGVVVPEPAGLGLLGLGAVGLLGRRRRQR